MGKREWITSSLRSTKCFFPLHLKSAYFWIHFWAKHVFTHICSSITSSTGSFPASFRVSFLTVILTISELFELHRLPYEGATTRRRRQNVIIGGGVMFLTTLTLAIGTAWRCHDKSSKKEIRACLSFVCENRSAKQRWRVQTQLLNCFQFSLESFWNWSKRAFKEKGPTIKWIICPCFQHFQII